MTAPPSTEVIAAFGGQGRPAALDGGEGVTFQVNGLVVKHVRDVNEAEWVAELCSRMKPDGFRVPEQVRTLEGDWVYEGWTATRFIAGLRPLQPEWEEIIDIGLRFGDAADRVPMETASLAKRTHRWARADRVAWGQEMYPITGSERIPVAQAMVGVFTRPARRDGQIIHGDLTGNVAISPGGMPVVLDVSPYVRPRRWAAAIVVADAVLWNDAPLALAQAFAADDADLLGRALLFRLVAEQMALEDGETPRHHLDLTPYRRVLTALA